MVSIRNSLTELDKIYDVQNALLECYASALTSIQQYAVEIDDEITPAHRQHLEAIRTDLPAQLDLVSLTDNRALLRHELRDYRDRAAVSLANLHRELSEKADALQSIVEAMASIDGDHEQDLESSLARLRSLAATPRAEPVRTDLNEISDCVRASIDKVRKQHQLTVGQFISEIKTLHRRIGRLEAAGRQDVLTGLLNRVELETRLASAIEHAKTFPLLVLRLCNLPVIQRQFGAGVRTDVISAFAKRMASALPHNAVVGRWSEDRFLVILSMDKLEAMSLAKRVTQHVTGVYVCVDNGKPQRPSLQVNVSVIDHSAGNTFESLINRLNQL
jgi:diguanylate cyclase (GGDEF)-like protein